jgi:integrase
VASLHKDPRNKSPFWYCAYTLPDGHRAFRSTKQRDRKKAFDVCRTLEKASEKARAGELTEIQVRKLLDDILESVGQRSIRAETVRSFFLSWLAGKRLSTKPGVYQHYNKAVSKFLESLGQRADKSLASVTAGDIAAFRDARLKLDGISTGTLVLDMKAVRSVFSSATRQGLILHNPAVEVDLPVNKPHERDVFTSEEIRALLHVARPEWQTLVLLGYYLGGRLTDMVSLDWDAVDLTSGIIRYTQGKTGRRVEVPIHPDLEERLMAIGGDQPRGHLCQTLVKSRVDGRNGLSNQFAGLMAQAGIDQRQVQSSRNSFSRKSFHSLRHSFSSALANVGISADVRMKLTGHKSADVHQRYTHLELEPLKRAIAALPSLNTGARR